MLLNKDGSETLVLEDSSQKDFSNPNKLGGNNSLRGRKFIFKEFLIIFSWIS